MVEKFENKSKNIINSDTNENDEIVDINRIDNEISMQNINQKAEDKNDYIAREEDSHSSDSKNALNNDELRKQEMTEFMKEPEFCEDWFNKGNISNIVTFTIFVIGFIAMTLIRKENESGE